ncbi:radical SAM family heme chaperone HemW [Alkalicoccus urumqiensis]|uniref:Heme chaperone HemW n=1 Tax=Alkalicoccus urumqiensis TaxID=1548213 RepID=A0A2P6MFS0_ALKUR|nr:radical SAM family heme chaperone HemW [Alkalicoccus urumqiensis]PRO65090.1 coproporphyrinogen III oxidase [Alkalicoccus urumqiensis]
MRRSLYLHVPFCGQICHYCDFNKFFLHNQPVDRYVQAVEKELKETAEALPPPDPIETIYVGGGTPTAVTPEQLRKMLRAVRTYFPVSNEVEFTVEVNPGSADASMMRMLKEEGVNRLSIGAQTFDEGLLRAINRDHKAGQVEETIHLAREHGLTNLSIDLMFGLPTQTMGQWKDTLKRAVSLPITHISAYALKVEPKTVFYQMEKRGQLVLPTVELEADMYEELKQAAADAGMTQYEISNFAAEGFESMHNLAYWNNDEYYGIGAGAHSYTDSIRRRNFGPLPQYLKAVETGSLPYLEQHTVPVQEKMEEEMFMGLRKRLGVSRKQFQHRYNRSIGEVFPGVVEALTSRGLLASNGDRLFLTEEGKLLGNDVFEQFLLAADPVPAEEEN